MGVENIIAIWLDQPINTMFNVKLHSQEAVIIIHCICTGSITPFLMDKF